MTSNWLYYVSKEIKKNIELFYFLYKRHSNSETNKFLLFRDYTREFVYLVNCLVVKTYCSCKPCKKNMRRFLLQNYRNDVIRFRNFDYLN